VFEEGAYRGRFRLAQTSGLARPSNGGSDVVLLGPDSVESLAEEGLRVEFHAPLEVAFERRLAVRLSGALEGVLSDGFEQGPLGL
jgi:hypothetical protein